MRYDATVLSTIEKLGLQALISNKGFDIAQHYADRCHDINAATPYYADHYLDARASMLEELTTLVGKRLAEVLDDGQLDGASFGRVAMGLIEDSDAAIAQAEIDAEPCFGDTERFGALHDAIAASQAKSALFDAETRFVDAVAASQDAAVRCATATGGDKVFAGHAYVLALAEVDAARAAVAQATAAVEATAAVAASTPPATLTHDEIVAKIDAAAARDAADRAAAERNARNQAANTAFGFAQ